ncbi:MAG: hypothetical protein ACON5D_19210 [Rubripirellula sp.]
MSHPATLIALSLTAAYLLLLLECFLPTSGILAILSFAFLIAAVTLGFSVGVTAGIFVILIILVLTPLLIRLLIKLWPSTSIGQKILNIPQSGRDRKKNPPEFRDCPTSPDIDQQGISITHLQPHGIADFGDGGIEVVTQGEFIESGRTIRVLENRMGRIYVTSTISIS